MLSKCANPSCSNEFHYFGEGKVFEIRLDKKPSHSQPVTCRPPGVEHYWLCSDCSSTLTIATDPGLNIMVVPRNPPRRAREILRAVAS